MLTFDHGYQSVDIVILALLVGQAFAVVSVTADARAKRLTYNTADVQDRADFVATATFNPPTGSPLTVLAYYWSGDNIVGSRTGPSSTVRAPSLASTVSPIVAATGPSSVARSARVALTITATVDGIAYTGTDDSQEMPFTCHMP